MLDVTQLVERSAEGDRDAFSELVRRYRGLVFSVCFQRTGNWDDSEDLTQEVFVAVHRSLPSAKEPAKFAAWLRGVADNVCRMHWRKQPRGRVPLGEEVPLSDEWAESARSLALEGVLHRALSDIPEAGREVVSLRYLGGYSYAEIGALCGLPEKTVRSRLYEGRQQLKARLLRTVAELCECSRDADHTVHCVLERCGTEACKCVDRLLGG
jgi:RNA polymerase sigma-70 factor (ECF subfamily)